MVQQAPTPENAQGSKQTSRELPLSDPGHKSIDPMTYKNEPAFRVTINYDTNNVLYGTVHGPTKDKVGDPSRFFVMPIGENGQVNPGAEDSGQIDIPDKFVQDMLDLTVDFSGTKVKDMALLEIAERAKSDMQDGSDFNEATARERIMLNIKELKEAEYEESKGTLIKDENGFLKYVKDKGL